MITKYKIHEFSKDFGLKSNVIIDLVQKYFDVQKKSQTVLDTNEIDVLFDSLTQEYAVENLDEYFAMKRPQEEAPVQEAPAQEAPVQQAPAQEAPTAQAKPVNTGAPSVQARPQSQGNQARPQSQGNQARPQSQGNQARPQSQGNQARPQSQGNAAPAGANKPAVKTDSQPFKKKENKKPDTPIQARTKGERKTVDTRGGDIELDKYNEKYETLATGGMPGKDSETRKQKIKQKSQQYRKQGTRTQHRETESERLRRIADERSKRSLVITVGDEITVGELAMKLKIAANEVIKKLFSYGVMAGINEKVDFDTAAVVASELDAKVEREVVVTIEDRIIDDSTDKDDALITRSPVVCVMGHVDHGKTSLLDAIRHTEVTATESGGITQHIGAYRVHAGGADITFLDTPGHAAFTSMRARGAKATDIAVLVVAADDGIMPQTIEAINHAKAAEVNVIVAINKMDKPDANPDRILQQLTEYELVPEQWGGETICVPVSAKTGEGIDKLLESILLVAEMRELKANPNRAAKGIVIEARLDKGKGPIATLLVQNGTLNDGDIIVAGTAVGRVRVMTDYKGKKVKSAGPSVPVEVMGLAEAPQAGDLFDAVSDEKLARELVEQRKQKIKDEQFNAVKRVTLDTLFSTLAEGERKELNIIVKADVQGSVEALKQNLEELSNEEVKVSVIHGGVGAIVESDVMLAAASDAIIIGFHVRPDPTAVAHAERDHVEMRMYRVIYDCTDDVKMAIKGMLAPKFRDVEQGRIEVRQVFKLSTSGVIAGSYIVSGKVTRASHIRVVRDGIVIAEDEIASLRRMKDDVKEVAAGYECGIGIAKFSDVKVGDIFEAYIVEEYRD